ncbi:DNA alkylation repair protein [uncultured Paludibaculum sp.]|uniref:DNA alkylation repair protein n=1 Tax=uncultured Paludibaculum sp. TaxID=1765020 RepID=UPI002AAAD294|nr:DNA alkylation repair protein [uncultured Paludibaculum sp.]
MSTKKNVSGDVAALAAEIRAYCAANANPTLANKWARYFKEGYDAWGVLDKDHPLWNAQQAAWLETHSHLGLKGFLLLGETLFASGKYEEGGLAIRFLKSYSTQIDARALPGIAKWFPGGIRNWAHVDVLCGEVLSPALAAGRLGLQDFAVWRTSPERFQRRAVPVAMLSLLKTSAPTAELLSFVRPLMLDPERVVQQGLGWFLRETWKREPQPVEELLMEFRSQAPRVIYQYACEKMTPARRTAFRRG